MGVYYDKLQCALPVELLKLLRPGIDCGLAYVNVLANRAAEDIRYPDPLHQICCLWRSRRQAGDIIAID